MLLYLSGPSQIWLNWCFSTYQWLFTAVLLASGMHLQTAGWHPMQPHLDLPLQPQEHSQLQTYERNDFRGRMLEFRSDCPSLQENNCRDILSHHIPKERCVFFFFLWAATVPETAAPPATWQVQAIQWLGHHDCQSWILSANTGHFLISSSLSYTPLSSAISAILRPRSSRAYMG